MTDQPETLSLQYEFCDRCGNDWFTRQGVEFRSNSCPYCACTLARFRDVAATDGPQRDLSWRRINPC